MPVVNASPDLDHQLVDPAPRLLLVRQVATALLGTSDPNQMIQRLADLVVPEVADWCAVDMPDAEGRIERLAVAHVDPAKVAMARAYYDRYPPDPQAPSGVYQVLASGRPEHGEIPDAALEQVVADVEQRAMLRELGLRSYCLYPLVADDRVLGVLTLVQAESGRVFRDHHLPAVDDLTVLVALAIQNTRLSRENEAAREEVRAGRQRLESLITHLPQLAWSTGVRGGISLHNGHGLSEEQGRQLLSEGWSSLAPDLHTALTAALAGAEPFEITHPLTTAQGVRTHLTRVTPLLDRNGRVLRWVGTSTDIHELRAARALAEAVTAHSEEVLQTIRRLQDERDAALARLAVLQGADE